MEDPEGTKEHARDPKRKEEAIQCERSVKGHGVQGEKR